MSDWNEEDARAWLEGPCDCPLCRMRPIDGPLTFSIALSNEPSQDALCVELLVALVAFEHPVPAKRSFWARVRAWLRRTP